MILRVVAFFADIAAIIGVYFLPVNILFKIFFYILLAIYPIILFIMFLKNRLSHFQDASRIGLKSIFKNRRELERLRPLDKFFSEAKNEVFIVALGPARIAAHYRDFIKELVDKGINFRFLLLNPNNPLVEQMAKDCHKDADTFRNEFIGSVEYLKELEKESQNLPGKVNVRVYDSVPTCSLIFIDGDKRWGKMIVELLPCGIEASARPSFEITYKNEKDSILSIFYRQYDNLWKNSESPNGGKI